MQLTPKQFSIMVVICKGNGTDPKRNLIPVDMNELLERLSYRTTKDSMQFSIRALIRSKLIYKGPRETRRGRGRITFFPTELGRQLTKLGASPSFVEPSSTDPVLHALAGTTPATAEVLKSLESTEPWPPL